MLIAIAISTSAPQLEASASSPYDNFLQPLPAPTRDTPATSGPASSTPLDTQPRPNAQDKATPATQPKDAAPNPPASNSEPEPAEDEQDPEDAADENEQQAEPETETETTETDDQTQEPPSRNDSSILIGAILDKELSARPDEAGSPPSSPPPPSVPPQTEQDIPDQDDPADELSEDDQNETNERNVRNNLVIVPKFPSIRPKLPGLPGLPTIVRTTIKNERPPTDQPPPTSDTPPDQSGQLVPVAAPPANIATVKLAPPLPRADASGEYVVQILATPHEDSICAIWDALRAELPDMFEYANRSITRVETGDNQVLFRLRVGTFNSRQEAAEFCDLLQTKGHSCFVPPTNEHGAGAQSGINR